MANDKKKSVKKANKVLQKFAKTPSSINTKAKASTKASKIINKPAKSPRKMGYSNIVNKAKGK